MKTPQYVTFDFKDGSSTRIMKHTKHIFKGDLIDSVQRIRDTLILSGIKPSVHNMLRCGLSQKSIYTHKRHCFTLETTRRDTALSHAV